MADSDSNDILEKQRRLKEKLLQEDSILSAEMNRISKLSTCPKVRFAEQVKLADEIRCKDLQKQKERALHCMELRDRLNSEEFNKQKRLQMKKSFIEGLTKQIKDNKDFYYKITKYNKVKYIQDS